MDAGPPSRPAGELAAWELFVDGEPTVGDVRAALGAE
jgi:hypothetical protein